MHLCAPVAANNASGSPAPIYLGLRAETRNQAAEPIGRDPNLIVASQGRAHIIGIASVMETVAAQRYNEYYAPYP